MPRASVVQSRLQHTRIMRQEHGSRCDDAVLSQLARQLATQLAIQVLDMLQLLLHIFRNAQSPTVRTARTLPESVLEAPRQVLHVAHAASAGRLAPHSLRAPVVCGAACCVSKCCLSRLNIRGVRPSCNGDAPKAAPELLSRGFIHNRRMPMSVWDSWLLSCCPSSSRQAFQPCRLSAASGTDAHVCRGGCNPSSCLAARRDHRLDKSPAGAAAAAAAAGRFRRGA